MRTYNYFGNEQKIYYDKLSNGLEIYLIPNNDHANYHIEIVTKYGSGISEFIPVGKKEYYKLPLGVAHFLEHKMFDMEKGDAFSFYSKTGTYINAGTSYFCTRYYIDGKKAIKKNLDYLIDLVFTPYFTEERVNSEKGIIAEEIKMYDDEAEWILDYNSKNCVFKTTVTDKIAGTVTSIQKINPEIIKMTYDTFYQPSNMFIVITGNFNKNDILNVIKNNKSLKEIKSNQEIIIKKTKETKEVVSEYKLLSEDIILPKISYVYKFDLNDYGDNYLLTRMYLNLLFTHLFGDTSKFNDIVLEKSLVTDYYMDHLSFNNIYSMSVEAESEYADLLKDEVDKTMKNIMISEEDFERIKKIWISIVIRSLDNKESLASSIIDDLIKDGEVSDQLELINELNYQELLNIISKLDLSNKSFILMVPKEK